MLSLQTSARYAALMPNNAPRYVRIYDAGNHLKDRYTVVFTRAPGNYFLGMSVNPYAPNGFGQHGENGDGAIDRPTYAHLGKRIYWADLPEQAQHCALDTYLELWSLEKSANK